MKTWPQFHDSAEPGTIAGWTLGACTEVEEASAPSLSPKSE